MNVLDGSALPVGEFRFTIRVLVFGYGRKMAQTDGKPVHHYKRHGDEEMRSISSSSEDESDFDELADAYEDSGFGG